MVQKIKQANIFGRVGSGIGQGLAESIPKEIERGRLSGALQKLGQKKGLSPFEQFTGLVGAAHEYPQVVQSGSDILRTQGIREGFRPQGPGSAPQEYAPGSQTGGIPQGLNPSATGGLPASAQPAQPTNPQGPQQAIPSGFDSRAAEAAAMQGSGAANPFNKQFQPATSWTPQQRDADLYREWERNPNMSYEQAQARSADNEKRMKERPLEYQEQQKYIQGQEDAVDAEFDKQLETALQKEGKEVYKDLTGDTLLDLKKAMRNDLLTNPSLNPKTAAEKWRKIGKDFVEHKNQLKELASRDLLDKISPGKSASTLKALQQTQKSYANLGRKRELYNTLRTVNDPETKTHGFGLSPGGAASIAYPKSTPLQEEFNRVPKYYTQRDATLGNTTKITNKIAEGWLNNRSYDDSLVGYIHDLRKSGKIIDENAFLDYVRENQDQFALSPDQKKELDLPRSDYFPNWGDLTLFPWY